MTFSRAGSNTHYRSLRLVSAEERWELGLNEYASGMRVRMGRFGRPPSVLDFCIGHDRGLCMPVLLAVITVLEGIPESANEKEIDAMFPWAGTRPDMSLHLDALLALPGKRAEVQARKRDAASTRAHAPSPGWQTMGVAV